jgi:hypothetical protein
MKWQNPPAERLADISRQNPFWRRVIETAIAEGDLAESAISARALDQLLKLPPGRRREIVDRHVEDRRLADLAPSDMERLRESLNVKVGGGARTVDRIQAAADRRTKQAAALEEYIAGYEAQVRAAKPYLVDQFTGYHRNPVAAAGQAIAALLAMPNAAIESIPHPAACGRAKLFAGTRRRMRAVEAVCSLLPIIKLLISARAERGALRK